MAGSPMWTGVLTIDAIAVPVKMLAVGESPSAVSFNHAHRCRANRFTRLQQRRWCPTCQKELARGDVHRVFETAPGQYFEVSDADLAKCEVAPSSTLTITTVLTTPLYPMYIDTTACLSPNGPAAYEPFETIRQALGSMTAVAELVLRKRAQRVMLQAADFGIIVYLLRHIDQVSALVPHIESSRSTPTTHALVQRLRARFHELKQSFDYEHLRDEYSARVRTMLADKITDRATDMLKAALPKRRSRSRKR